MRAVKRGIIGLCGALSLLTGCAGPGGEGFRRALSPVFLDLADYIRTGDELGTLYARFIVFIAAFSMMYYGADRVFGSDKKRIVVGISLALSLLGTIAIPSNVLIELVKTYSFVMAVVLGLVPFVAGLYFAHKSFGGNGTFDHVMRAIIYVILAYICATFVTSLEASSDPLFVQFVQWGWVGNVLLSLAAVFNIFGAVGHGGASLAGSARSMNFGGGGAKTAGGTSAASTGESQAATKAQAQASAAQTKTELADIDTLISEYEQKKI